MLNVLSMSLVVLVVVTATAILISQDWRWCLTALAIQYIGVFLLISNHWPLSMAITKLVTGWIGCVVLALARAEKRQPAREEYRPRPWGEPNAVSIPFTFSGKLLRWMAAGLVILTMMSIAPSAATWIPNVGVMPASGALILIGLGLLHLGMTGQSFRTILGLLTVLSGFEILYTAVEISVLVAGLLSGVTLGLSLTGAYLMLISPFEG